MSTNWILRTAKTAEHEKVLLICEEYDTYNYRYRYLSSVPRSITKLLSIAVVENGGTWLGDWFDCLKNEDVIHYRSKAYPWADIKNKVLEEVELFEEGKRTEVNFTKNVAVRLAKERKLIADFAASALKTEQAKKTFWTKARKYISRDGFVNNSALIELCKSKNMTDEQFAAMEKVFRTYQDEIDDQLLAVPFTD